ncbi:galactosyltransferase-related protein, partial [Escherichia coli]|nr:galactosyltransferase-related protein [Escherichia coli]
DALAPMYAQPPVQPVHIGRAWTRYPYKDYVGGIITFSGHDFARINGCVAQCAVRSAACGVRRA